MHQLISIAILLAVAFLFNAPLAANMASAGQWGEAVGRLFVGPVAFFYIAHSVVYYATRAARGADKVGTYAGSRLNYVALVITLLGILGALAQRA